MNTNSCPKTFNKKQSLGAYSITQIETLQTRKTRQINLFNAIPKTFNDAKFVVDGNAFQTFITHSFISH